MTSKTYVDGKIIDSADAHLCKCIEDRREGLAKIMTRLSAENPTWSEERLKARAKIAWHAGARE